MAARVQVTVTDAGVQGVVRAADADEEALFSLLREIALRCPHFDASTHTTGVLDSGDVPAAVDAVHEVVDEGVAATLHPAWGARWAAVLAETLGTAKARGAAVIWTTTYDQGGSVDDGPLEFASGAELSA